MNDFNKRVLTFKLLDLGYEYHLVNEYVDLYSQNLNTLKQNVKDFKEWIKD